MRLCLWSLFDPLRTLHLSLPSSASSTWSFTSSSMWIGSELNPLCASGNWGVWPFGQQRPSHKNQRIAATRTRVTTGHIRSPKMQIPNVYMYPRTAAGTPHVNNQLFQAFFSACQSSWQPYKDTSAPTKPWVFKRHVLNKSAEPQDDTPMVVESLDTQAPLVPSVRDAIHPV